jgi:hypothetical protein
MSAVISAHRTNRRLEAGQSMSAPAPATSFHLAAIVQNLKTMALRLLGPPTDGVCVRRLRKRLGRSVLVFADQAATPNQE